MTYLRHLTWALAIICLQAKAQNVGIGTDSPDASAKLDITSTNSGVLVPRLNTGQRTSISSPANGLLVYDTTTNSFWFYQSSEWVELVSDGELEDDDRDTKVQVEESTDEDQIRFDVAGTEAMVLDENGRLGLSNSDPDYDLDVTGSFRLNGDFFNQEVTGLNSGTLQAVPYTNATFNPITGMEATVTVLDGSGVNNSAVYISGFARVFGGNLIGNASSVGGFFFILQRDTDPLFTSAVNLTYTAAICYLETPNGVSSATLSFGAGPHISYVDDNLAAGTYYYRFVMYPNGTGITGGTYDVYQRTMNILQIKR